MSSRLDQSLDDVIESRRRGRGYGNRRSGDRDYPRNSGFSTRRDNSGGIRKRLGNVHNDSTTIRSFVRTVNVQNNDRRGRNVNSQWAHDKFDDDDDFPMQRSVLSRLGNQKPLSERISQRGVEIKIENLHYNVTEKDLEDLFGTVGDVMKARIAFDPSGRSTGVGFVKYHNMEDAEKAIQQYHKLELDGQAMSIGIEPRKTRESNRESRRDGGRPRGGFRDNRDRGRDSRRPRDNRGRTDRNDRKKDSLSAEDLDREMESYMQSNSNNNNDEDAMMLD